MAQPEEQESAWPAARRLWRAFWGAEAPPQELLPPPPQREAGWPAVQRLWHHLLGTRQMNGEQAPEVPGEIAQGWKAVLAALCLGALGGGLKQWDEEKKRAMKTLLMPRPLAHRNLTPKVACLLRMSDAALRCGAAWGGFTAFSLGVHALCVVYRGSRVWGVDGAAAAAAASAVGALHHLSRSPRTWPLQAPVADHLKGMALFFFTVGVVLDEGFGLAEAEEQRKAEAAAKEAAAEADKTRRAQAAEAQRQRDAAAELLAQLEAAQRQRDAAAELLAQLEAAQRQKAGGGAAAAAAQLAELQQRQQPS